MDGDKYKCLLNNFLSLDFKKQLEVLSLFSNVSNEKIKKNLIKQFEEYATELTVLINSIDLYSSLNSTKRRYLRYAILCKLEEEIFENEINNSKCRRDEVYAFLNKCCYLESFPIGLYDNVLRRYFYFKKISDKDLELAISQFCLETDDNKNKIVDEFCFSYLEINSYEGYRNRAIEMYDGIIKKIIGEDLYEYYQLLPTDIKYRLIKKYCSIVSSIIKKNDDQLKIENKMAVRQKKENIKTHRLRK